MTIKQGYKVIFPDGSYTVAESEKDAEKKSQLGYWNNRQYELSPVLYAKKSKNDPFVIIEPGEDKLKTIKKLFDGYIILSTSKNTVREYQNPKFFLWNEVIEAGKSYMVGSEVETKQFIKTHSSGLSDWQIFAFEYVKEHPEESINIQTTGKRRFTWHVFLEGDHVILELPYHGEGGEKTWCAHIDNPKTKILINVD